MVINVNNKIWGGFPRDGKMTMMEDRGTSLNCSELIPKEVKLQADLNPGMGQSAGSMG